MVNVEKFEVRLSREDRALLKRIADALEDGNKLSSLVKSLNGGQDGVHVVNARPERPNVDDAFIVLGDD